MKKPLVSIIIPNYNKEEFLSICIQSVLNQTYKNFEIIIIDNFSSDRSLDVIKKFIDPRINLFQFKNNGIIAASRNFGIKKSNGKYLAFLDSDDYWMKDKLSESVKVLEKGADFIYHDCILFSKNFKKRRITKSRSLKIPIKKDLIFNGNDIVTSSVVLRKELFISITNFSENINLIANEDFDAWIRFSFVSNKFVYLPIPLGYLFVGPSNTSNSTFFKLKGSKELLLIYSKEFERSKKIPNHLYYNIAVSYFRLGCYKLALKNSFRINPFDLKNYQLIKIIFLFLSSMILIPFSNKKNIKNLGEF